MFLNGVSHDWKKRCNQDRRVVFISLTDKGRVTVEELHKLQEESLLSYFETLRDVDVQHLKRILAMLLANVNKN